MIIVTLDISTTSTGVAIFDDKELIFTTAYIAPKKYKKDTFLDLFNLANDMITQLTTSITALSVDEPSAVIIEKPLGNSMNRKTVNMLLTYNAIVSTLCELGIGPVSHMTRNLAIKEGLSELVVPRKNGAKPVMFGAYDKGIKAKDKKTIVASMISEIYDINFERTKAGNIKSYQFDIADAILLGRAYLNIVGNDIPKVTIGGK